MLTVRTISQFGTVPLYGDGDDAMRMASAIDLLNGQSWFDPVQYRDNSPFGASMHWSRLLDAPLAAGMAFLSPLFGPHARDLVAFSWPLLLLLPLLCLSVSITKELVPEADTLTATVLPCLGIVLLIEFLPGRVDHHSVQILLMLTLLLAMLKWRETSWGGLVAGGAAATSLAIGLETLPLVVVAIVLHGVLWFSAPLLSRRATKGFALGLGGGAILHFVAATPPSSYLGVTCDNLSIVYVLGVCLAAAGLWASASFLSFATQGWRRAGGLVISGLLPVLLCGGLFPQCLGGPYGAVPQEILGEQFSMIAEVQSFWTRLFVDPATAIAFCIPSLLGLALTAREAITGEGESKQRWYIALAFVGMACITMLFQIRAARFADPLALPALAAFILRARGATFRHRSIMRTLGLVGAWIASAGSGQFALVGVVVGLTGGAQASNAAVRDQRSAGACFLASNYTKLAALPPGRVMSAPPLGAHVLLYTDHSVVSAGFHRNDQGNLDQLSFFSASEDDARTIVDKRGLDYVAFCPGALEEDGVFSGILGQWRSGNYWDWLLPLTAASDPIQVLRISLPKSERAKLATLPQLHLRGSYPIDARASSLARGPGKARD
ncbi:MAG: hypothetical protein ABIO40_09595 [Devosia sp.]